MNENSLAPQSGWYPDPDGSGLRRWWDGEKWGPHEPDGSQPQYSRPQVPEAHADTDSVKKTKRIAIFSLALAILALLFIVFPKTAAVLALISLFLAYRTHRDNSAPKRQKLPAKIGTVLSVFVLLVGLMQSLAAPRSDVQATDSSAAEVPFDPAEFTEVEPREFSLITKDPDQHKGKQLILYGVVSQFDANTGTCDFRADTGSLLQYSDYEYDENSYISGMTQDACDYLADNVVEGDIFKAWVTVEGSITYSTHIGGTMSALELNGYQFEVVSEAS